MRAAVEQAINNFAPISLEEMDTIKLMNRQDTKYLFSRQQLAAVLKDLSACYRILEIDNQRIMSYSNVYFDTPDFLFYHKHHSGKLNRYKIRNRAYVDSDLAFCEVKFKSNKKRTEKNRKLLEAYEQELNADSKNFIAETSPVATDELEPKLYMDFNRITLAHKNFEDRCTIDLDLVANNKEVAYPFSNLVIAEIKQKKFSASSDFNQILKSFNIYPMGFSKYCIGVAATYKSIKQNRFKPKFLFLNKLLHGTA